MIKDKKDKVINLLLERIATLEYEVEELQKENDLNCNLNKSLLKDIDKAGKEIERLNNIIKEVRENINKKLNVNSDYVDYDFGTELLRQELLEILDKENK